MRTRAIAAAVAVTALLLLLLATATAGAAGAAPGDDIDIRGLDANGATTDMLTREMDLYGLPQIGRATTLRQAIWVCSHLPGADDSTRAEMVEQLWDANPWTAADAALFLTVAAEVLCPGAGA